MRNGFPGLSPEKFSAATKPAGDTGSSPGLQHPPWLKNPTTQGVPPFLPSPSSCPGGQFGIQDDQSKLWSWWVATLYQQATFAATTSTFMGSHWREQVDRPQTLLPQICPAAHPKPSLCLRELKDSSPEGPSRGHERSGEFLSWGDVQGTTKGVWGLTTQRASGGESETIWSGGQRCLLQRHKTLEVSHRVHLSCVTTQM